MRDEPVTLKLRLNPNNNQEVAFEDENWAECLPSLKPMGLNFMLNTDREVHMRRGLYTLKRVLMRAYGPLAVGRLSTRRNSFLYLSAAVSDTVSVDLRYLSKAIGFSDDAVRGMVRRRDILVLPLREDISAASASPATTALPSPRAVEQPDEASKDPLTQSGEAPKDSLTQPGEAPKDSLTQRVVVHKDLPMLPSMVSVIIQVAATCTLLLPLFS